jgi:hypothetical protein
MSSAIDRLIEHYGIKQPPVPAEPEARIRWLERLHSKVLYHVLRDGRVRLPSGRKRGRPLTPRSVKGSFGRELVEGVEAVQREGLRQGRSISQEDAIEGLRAQFPEKWGSHEPDTLLRRYQEAKHLWDYTRRLGINP